jgi:hypothetical protein
VELYKTILNQKNRQKRTTATHLILGYCLIRPVGNERFTMAVKKKKKQEIKFLWCHDLFLHDIYSILDLKA